MLHRSTKKNLKYPLTLNKDTDDLNDPLSPYGKLHEGKGETSNLLLPT